MPGLLGVASSLRLQVAAHNAPAALRPLLAPLLAAHLRRISPTADADSLEAAVRPVLLPSEQWGDLERWRGNARLLAWLRSAYIASRDETRATLPAADRSLQAYPGTLPHAHQIREIFGTRQPDGAWPPPPPREPPPPRSPKESTAGVPLGEVLEAAGGLVAGRNALNIWMERRGVYELLTTELVGALGGYLRGRLARLGRRLGRRPRLLEAGAADGHLVAHLRASLAGERGEAAVADVFACDDFSTAAPGGVRAARSRGVEQLGYWEALAEHKPDMVVCAWMPMGVDWWLSPPTEEPCTPWAPRRRLVSRSHAFRHTPTVREYLLLGEADDGSVGHLWRTWGNPAFRPPTAPPSLPPPYLADGWERADLPEIGRWMLNRFDSDLDPHGSRAVSFVRLNS
jgi:hypothetical protein